MEDNHLWAAIWVCLSVVIVSGFTALTYYNLKKPNDEEIALRKEDIRLEMIRTYHINPAIFECMDRSWASLPEYEICKELFSKIEISPEEQDRIRLLLNEGDK